MTAAPSFLLRVHAAAMIAYCAAHLAACGAAVGEAHRAPTILRLHVDVREHRTEEVRVAVDGSRESVSLTSAEGRSEHRLSIWTRGEHRLTVDVAFRSIDLGPLATGSSRVQFEYPFTTDGERSLDLCVVLSREHYRWDMRVRAIDAWTGECPPTSNAEDGTEDSDPAQPARAAEPDSHVGGIPAVEAEGCAAVASSGSTSAKGSASERPFPTSTSCTATTSPASPHASAVGMRSM